MPRPVQKPNWCLDKKILLFQVGHDPPVHHFLHDFGEDAQQGHRAIVLIMNGCSGPFLVDWDDVRRLPQGWLSAMLIEGIYPQGLIESMIK